MNNTEVVFEDIEQRILKEINNAHYAIFVSVAWFTNKRLFQALVSKAKENCYVSIIIQLDEINSQSGIDFNEIKIGRSECFFVPKDTELLHDKFCVIDFQKVITGSYNWTYKATYNSENIMIVTDSAIASQYISRFEQQKQLRVVAETTKPQIKVSVPTPSINQKQDIQKECSNCGRPLQPTDNYCTYCGEQIRQAEYRHRLICPKCQREQPEIFIDAQSKYCIYCGSQKLIKKANLKILKR